MYIYLAIRLLYGTALMILPVICLCTSQTGNDSPSKNFPGTNEMLCRKTAMGVTAYMFE